MPSELVADAREESAFAAVAAVKAIEQQVLVAGLECGDDAVVTEGVIVEADDDRGTDFVAAAVADADFAAHLVVVLGRVAFIAQNIPDTAPKFRPSAWRWKRPAVANCWRNESVSPVLASPLSSGLR